MVRNVLLVTIDSLRALPFLNSDAREALGCYDRLLDLGGTEFSAAFATGPETKPSFPGILTGTYPLSMGGFEPLDEDRPFLARILSERGFTTGGFNSNPFLSESFNYDTGFDEFEDYQNPLIGVATSLFPRGIEDLSGPLGTLDRYLSFSTALRKAYQLVEGKPRPYVAGSVITDDAISFIRGADRPFFCWAHYMDVHHPCYPPAEYRERYDIDPEVTVDEVGDLYPRFINEGETLTEDEIDLLWRLYVAAIAYVSDEVDRLLDAVEETAGLDETVVVMTSDHGELFGEHGAYSKPELLHDELLRVPLVATNVPEGTAAASDELVSLLDIPPMVQRALGQDLDPAFEGVVPDIDAPRDYVLAEHTREDDRIIGARSKQWRYVVDEIRDEERLFRIDGDKERRVDHETVAEEVAPELVARVSERMAEIGTTEAEDLGVEGSVSERLRALGYRE